MTRARKGRSGSPPAREVRREAEQRLGAEQFQPFEAASEQDLRAMVHELRVFQGELEMQNDDLQRAQVAAQESSDTYHELFDSAPTGYFRLDEKGEILEANSTGAALLGQEAGGLVKTRFALLVVEEDRAEFAAFQERVLQTGAKQTGEFRFLQGERRIRGLVEAIARREQAGKPSCCTVTVTDVTELRRTEEKLTWLASFPDENPNPVVRIGRDGTVLYHNKAAAALLETWGCGDGGILSGPWLQFVLDSLRAGSAQDTECECGDRVFAVTFAPVADAGYVNLYAFDITDRKRADEALRQSEAQYRALIETTGTGYVVLDLEGRVVDANAEYARLAGHSDAAELRGRSVREWTAEHHSAKSAEAIRQCVREGYVRNLEIDHVDLRGNVIPIEVNATVVDTGGTPRILTLCRDITERKRAEEMLRNSHQELQAIYDGMLDGLLIAEVDTARFVRVNRSMCRMLGYSESELLSLSVRDIHPADEVESVLAFFHAQARGDKAVVEGIPVLRKGGSVFFADISASAIAYRGRSCLMGFFRDVTERRQAEQARAQLIAILEATPDFVGFASAKDQHILYINRAGRQMVGIGQDEDLTNVSLSDVHPAWTNKMFSDEILPVATRDGVWRGECAFRSRDGREIPVLMVLLAHKSATGAVQVFSTVSRDISDRKRVEAELVEAKTAAEAANRAKSEFLANMSHEIRTPMTAILGFADLLTMPDLSGGEQNQYLSAIQRNGKALLELINDILDLSRIEAEKLVLEKAYCPLQQMVEDVLSVSRVRAQEKGLSLEADYRFPLPERIETDAARLRQILVNLVGNAVKFTERGGVRVRVELKDEGGGMRDEVRTVPGDDADQKGIHPSSLILRFSVSDTGIGIPAEKIGGLFRPFVQADASLTRRYGGTGLGLAISKRLAKALGGDIEVASELGKGSTFTLRIDAGPLKGMEVKDEGGGMKDEVRTVPRDDADPKGIHPSSLIPHPSLRGRVLLAEDAVDVQVAVGKILRKMGLEVEIVENGRLACEMVEESEAEGRPLDLILMDIQMPEMNGYEATRRLRRQGWQRPIVALTAHAMRGDREKCLEAGCDDYVAKPISVTGLWDLLARYLSPTLPATAPVAFSGRAEPACLLEGGFLDPAEAARLVEAFAGELPTRARNIETALGQGNRRLLAELTHQLKGTAGIYGFSQIAEAARAIHGQAEDQDLERLQAAVAELVRLCEQRDQPSES